MHLAHRARATSRAEGAEFAKRPGQSLDIGTVRQFTPSPLEPATEASTVDAQAQGAPAGMSRARLLKRVFDIDIEHCPNCGGSLDHRRCRRSAGDCQNPQPSGPAQPRPALRAGAALRFIPNDLRSRNRLPTLGDGAARSEFERTAP